MNKRRTQWILPLMMRVMMTLYLKMKKKAMETYNILISIEKKRIKKMQVSKRIWTVEKNNIFVPLVHVLFSSVRKIQYLNQIISKEVILMSTLRCLFWC